MKVSMKSGQRSFKPPFLMLTILGIHVVAAGFFMMMSGCSTRKPVVEPPPAPVMPPSARIDTMEPAPVSRPVFKAPVRAETAPSSSDAADASSYTIQKGDTLSKIAVRSGVSIKEISELNNITDPNKIRIGQKILLPAHAKSLPSAPAPKQAVAKASKAPSGPAVDSGNVHQVVSGDTLGKLAVRYGTSVSAFKTVNNLKSDMIRIGQKLKIPDSGSASSAPAAPEAEPVSVPSMPEPAAAAPVAAAETMAAMDANVSEAADVIDDAADTTPFPYTVKKDDTLESISLKFSARKDVIMRLNNMTSETVTPGQKLLIPWQ